MIERFNGRIAEVLATTRFDSAEHFADTIKRYVKVYNQHIPQKALGHSPPLQAVKNWSQKQTQLFKKCAYNLARLDNYPYTLIGIIERPSRAKHYERWITQRSNAIRAVSDLVYLDMKQRYQLALEPVARWY